MAKVSVSFLFCAIIAACTCGARTECESRGHVALLTSIHEDAACKKLSSKGVLMYEAAKLLSEIHNNKSNTGDIELAVFDTCGSVTGALKAAMKALVTADVNCLQPPYFLGLIGPDSATSAEAVHKVTSVLKIPHIVQTSSASPYLHNLIHESDSYLVQGAMKVIKALKWKSFTLIADTDDEADDDVQNIAKKLTMQAISKGLCVIVHDNDEQAFSSHVVHVGQPEEGFFSGPVNATVLVISEGDLEDYLDNVNTSNSILLLEDSKDELAGLEAKVEKSKWWPADSGVGKYNVKEMTEVRWLEDAIEVYAKAADSVCKKKKCKNQVNPVDWNNVLSTILTAHNTEAQGASQSLNLLLKSKHSKFQEVADVLVQESTAKIHWAGQKSKDDEDDDEDNDEEEEKEVIPKAFAKLISQGKEKKVGCATKESKIVQEEDEENSHVVFQEMDDNEWWTTVGTVSGVGVSMFIIGTLAVYIVYTNIRGPVSKNRIERDSTLRRGGSDRDIPARVQRQSRAPQRRDSNRSVRSTISEKSV